MHYIQIYHEIIQLFIHELQSIIGYNGVGDAKYGYYISPKIISHMVGCYINQ